MEPGGSTVSHWPSLGARAEQPVTLDWSMKLQTCTVSSLMERNVGFIRMDVLFDLMLFKNTILQLT